MMRRGFDMPHGVQRGGTLLAADRATPVRTRDLRRSGHTARASTSSMTLTRIHRGASDSLVATAAGEWRPAKWGHEVLRSRVSGHGDPTRTNRINRDVLTGISLAVKGDATIHGPHLVARSVVSDWRNRRPRSSTQFNYQEMR